MQSQISIQELDSRWLMSTYKRQKPLFVRGCGAYLYDESGKAHLDFVAGVAVCSVGHCHPLLVKRLQDQTGRLMHVSNLFLTEPQAKLAARLCELSGMDRVFFCNSGAEACETAFKIARKHARWTKGSHAFEIVTLYESFHGRTMGALSATGQPKYQEPFEPLVPGFKPVTRNDLDALRSAIHERTAAVLIEPVQGESGVFPVSVEFLREARRLCDEFGALLIFDEVQCGMGRTGRWFAWEHAGVSPDLMTLAKGLGGGFPVGCCLAKGESADTLQPGDHGSTFAGNPMATIAALTVIEIIESEDLLANAAEIGRYLQDALLTFKADGLPIQEVRGMGLMIGVGLQEPAARDIAQHALELGLLVNPVGDETLRLVPPLTLTREEAEKAIVMLKQAMQSGV